ncbi:hypothetical protein [Alicyclobacillus dauci]|uniref:Uncharacterized protein n=1 Tax=Alicyclobacillus dauci TaxID=1475485 RepID=A0ABY6YWX2_9BACL|nr:hypothetical protein [Alicyclobacillus dauci]WAH35048.1 hypothetical protein NZD86_11985 [Alicyclobacillus dauci]WAH38237.1 hypothetical protein NZD86_07080 [Alicyclobacillus dauci]
MALIIPNIGYSAALDPVSGGLLAVFTKMDSISMDVDGTLTPVYGGAGAYPIVNIMADRKPMVSLSGSETSLQASSMLGANVTTASASTKVQVPRIEELTIGADGTVNLPNGDTISATTTTIGVVGALDNKAFTSVASAPTTGEYVTPVAGDAKVTFSTDDAGKAVVIYYTIDTSTGGQVDYQPSAVGKVVKFVASAKVVNTEDPSQALVPITFVVNSCQFLGKWTLSQERQKASAPKLDLQILDPGGGKAAVSIITTAKFAG